jgi:hypothetical protein
MLQPGINPQDLLGIMCHKALPPGINPQDLLGIMCHKALPPGMNLMGAS